MPSADTPASAPRSTELELDGHIVIEKDQSLELRVRLGYDVANPFAVSLDFLGEKGPLATWVLSRELLAEGLRKPSGVGDVRIWPPCHCHGRKLLRIMLKGDKGSAVIDVPAKPVRGWLRSECYGLVPAGDEGALIDWDAELRHLTGSR